MKILLLSDINSVHTKKWVIGLSAQGFSIGIFSLNRSESDWFNIYNNVSLLYQPDEIMDSDSMATKLQYLGNIKS